MRLALKLSLVLAASFCVVLFWLLRDAYRGQRERVAAAQAESLRRGVLRAAELCAPDAAAPQRCAAAIAMLAELGPAGAFSYAAALDNSLQLGPHTEPLDRNVALGPGGIVAAAHLVAASQYPDYLDQRVPAFGQTLRLQRVLSAPIPAGTGRAGTLVAAYADAPLDAAAAAVDEEARFKLGQARLIGAGIGILLATAVVFYFLAPLKRLVEAAREVGRGDFGRRLPETGDDELGALSAEFNAMTRRLGELDELKVSFMSKITHDLRNPLGAMLGHAELLQSGTDGPLTPAQEETVETLLRNGEQLARLIDNILDVSKLEAGKMEMKPQLVTVHERATEVLDLLQVVADGYGVELSSLLLPELKHVWCDPAAFRRILTNLLSNALKFTPKDGRVTLKAYRGAPNEAIFVVSDTGVGIPKERVATLFEKFSQVPETRNKVRQASGTGLGLAICKELVEANGGRIWVTSELLKGSSFHFTLPESASSTT